MLPDELNNPLKFTVNSNLDWERLKFEHTAKTAESLLCGHFRKK